MKTIFILICTYVDSDTRESSQHLAGAYTSRELAEIAKKYGEAHYICSFKICEVSLISKVRELWK